jgi:potassium/hydrogen antiporter
MESNVVQIVHNDMFMITLILLFGIITMNVAEKIKIPDVALFMIVGIILGPPVLHIIELPSNSVPYQFIIILGSILILFEGGRAIEVEVLKEVWVSISLLSVLGVIITTAVVAVAANQILGIPMIYSVLLAAIISSTDPATLIPVFKQVTIKERVRQTVESESAFNDATGSILTFTVLGVILTQAEISIPLGIKEFLIQAGGGIFIGVLVGYIGLLLKSEQRLGIFQKHAHIVGALMAIGAYLVAGLIDASGFMATFTAGVISGNPQLFKLRISEDAHKNLHHFGDTSTLIMRTLIFMLLGTQVDFKVLLQYGWQGLIIVFIFMFVARPLTVLACTLPDRKAKWNWREIVFMFWVRETGVIPAALSGMIVATGIKYGDAISAVTFIAILVTIVLQASTTGFVAKKLGLITTTTKSGNRTTT